MACHILAYSSNERGRFSFCSLIFVALFFRCALHVIALLAAIKHTFHDPGRIEAWRNCSIETTIPFLTPLILFDGMYSAPW